MENEKLNSEHPSNNNLSLGLWNVHLNYYKNFLFNDNNLLLHEYKEGFNKLNLNQNILPTIENLNAALKKTGWSVCDVHRFVKPTEFAELLFHRIFPICFETRDVHESEYSDFPDVVHSILGHLPFFYWAEYSEFIDAWSQKMLEAEPNDLEKEMIDLEFIILNSCDLSKAEEERVRDRINVLNIKIYSDSSRYTQIEAFYNHMAEFGILKIQNQPKVLGAAILSSTQTMKKIINRNIKLEKFSSRSAFERGLYTRSRNSLFYAECIGDYFTEMKKI